MASDLREQFVCVVVQNAALLRQVPKLEHAVLAAAEEQGLVGVNDIKLSYVITVPHELIQGLVCN